MEDCMSLAARKSDVKNHASRSTRKKLIAFQPTNLSDGTNTRLDGPPHAEETFFTKIDAGQGLSENIGDTWTDAEIKLLSP
jgi:hypothetical protein